MSAKIANIATGNLKSEFPNIFFLMFSIEIEWNNCKFILQGIFQSFFQFNYTANFEAFEGGANGRNIL